MSKDTNFGPIPAPALVSAPALASAQSRIAHWFVHQPRTSPLILFLVIMGITALIVFAIERDERADEKAMMRETAHNVSTQIENGVRSHVSFLRAGAALFTVLDKVDKPTFEAFVSELPLDDDPVGASGIGWAEFVEPGSIAVFEARNGIVISSRFDDAGLNASDQAASGSSSRLVVVTFLEPRTQANLRTIGYDLYSDPARRSAIDKAMQTARPTASGKLERRFRELGGEAGFLILMPVFDTASDGRHARGFVFSPIDAEAIIAGAVETTASSEFNIRLYDGEAHQDSLLAASKPLSTRGNFVREKVSIADHLLTVEVQSLRGYSLSPLSLETLLFGLVVATLLSVLLRTLAQQAIEDQASLERLEAESSIRNSLTRELNHRVKNTLANVLSIISLTRHRSDNLDGFAEALLGRVRAMSATHDLLTHAQWSETSLRSVLEAEINVELSGDDSPVILDGPDVLLAPNDALSLGLAIHELATNARKYGALSAVGGKVHVSWQMVDETEARVEWREGGGPKVPSQRKSGFGTELIEKVIAREFDRNVDLTFHPEGVRCSLQIPVRQSADFAMRETEQISDS